MAQQNNNDWYGSEIETPAVPMVDGGEGKPVILREFRFFMTPNALIPTNQMLFDSHWGYIKQKLWSDGLIANEDIAPRVVVGRRAYRIYIVCELNNGGKVREGKIKDKAKTITEIFDEKSKKTS